MGTEELMKSLTLAFRLTDDHVIENKIVGVKSLHDIIRNSVCTTFFFISIRFLSEFIHLHLFILLFYLVFK